MNDVEIRNLFFVAFGQPKAEKHQEDSDASGSE
jgi:hypothetical protein